MATTRHVLVGAAALCAVAIAISGCGPSVAQESATCPLVVCPPIPGVPDGVIAQPQVGDNLLRWQPVACATSYNIYWSTTSGVTPATGTKISVTGGPYTHAALSSGTYYYYVVTAMIGGLEGAPSQQVMATPWTGSPYLYIMEGALSEIIGVPDSPAAGFAPAVPGSPVGVTGTDPFAAVADPANGFLYVSDANSQQVESYSITAGTGQPAQVSVQGTTIAGPNGMAVSSTGQYLFVADSSANLIDTFAINTGLLSPLANTAVPGGGTTNFLATDPLGRFLFATGFSGGNLSVFTIDGAGGLSVASGSPYQPDGAGGTPVGVLADPSGRFVYVAGSSQQAVEGYAIGSTGQLTVLPGSPYPLPAAGNPRFLAIEPTGAYLYVMTESSGIAGYAINPASGALTGLPGSPYVNCPFSDGGITADPTGQFVYASCQNATPDPLIDAFSISSSTGDLTLASTPTYDVGAGTDPNGVIVMTH